MQVDRLVPLMKKTDSIENLARAADVNAALIKCSEAIEDYLSHTEQETKSRRLPRQVAQ